MNELIINYKEDNNIRIFKNIRRNFDSNLSDLIIPFSQFTKKENYRNIYDGTEQIPFEKRHPIFKAIMKIEFEDAIIQK